MTENQLRENDLLKIITKIRREYYSENCKFESDFVKWTERGESIKKGVLCKVRGLCNMARRNLEYLNMILEHYKAIGYIETEEMRKVMHDEELFYEAERRRLNQLKIVIPLVKPLAQLNGKGVM